MATWGDFAHAAPNLAAFGVGRFNSGPASLATVRADGSPRVHPVSPIISPTELFLFMDQTSPKGHDLRRDPRYAIHCFVADNNGGEGEFFISGTATLVQDSALRAIATEAGYKPKDTYILFRLSLNAVGAITYPEGGKPLRETWKVLTE